jgi:hypothetical protein
MKRVLIVQSIPYVLDLIKSRLEETFPQLKSSISYYNDFEKTLAEFPKEGEVVVIASDSYHDPKNELFREEEKNGSKLAEEIKKINPLAKVYIFSSYEPDMDHIDGFYMKTAGGDNTLEEIVDIFFDLELDA